MMPKSTATMRPSSSTNRLPGACRRGRSRRAWRGSGRPASACAPSALQSMPGGARARRGRRSGCRRSIRASARAARVRSQSTFGTRKPVVALAMFSAISEMRGGLQAQVHLDARPTAPSVSTTATGRSRREGGWRRSTSAGGEDRSCRGRAAKRCSMPGRSTLTATLQRAVRSAHCGLMHLRDRGGGHRRAELGEERRRPALPSAASTVARASSCGKGGSRSCSVARSRGELAARRCRRGWRGTGRA